MYCQPIAVQLKYVCKLYKAICKCQKENSFVSQLNALPRLISYVYSSSDFPFIHSSNFDPINIKSIEDIQTAVDAITKNLPEKCVILHTLLDGSYIESSTLKKIFSFYSYDQYLSQHYFLSPA